MAKRSVVSGTLDERFLVPKISEITVQWTATGINSHCGCTSQLTMHVTEPKKSTSCHTSY